MEGVWAGKIFNPFGAVTTHGCRLHRRQGHGRQQIHLRAEGAREPELRSLCGGDR